MFSFSGRLGSRFGEKPFPKRRASRASPHFPAGDGPSRGAPPSLPSLFAERAQAPCGGHRAVLPLFGLCPCRGLAQNLQTRELAPWGKVYSRVLPTTQKTETKACFSLCHWGNVLYANSLPKSLEEVLKPEALFLRGCKQLSKLCSLTRASPAHSRPLRRAQRGRGRRE